MDVTKESIILKAFSENLPQPLSVASRTDFAKEGDICPFLQPLGKSITPIKP